MSDLSRAFRAVSLALLLAGPAGALPIDFNDKLEPALLCRQEWSTAWFRDYLVRHLQQPVRQWGEASWWNSQGATLGGVATSEIFLNDDTSAALMLGVLIPQPVEAVRAKLEATFKLSFRPVTAPDGTRYVSDTASVLVGLSNQQTKWYCARWNTGNRERVTPLAPRR
jgi:hypothetical protein